MVVVGEEGDEGEVAVTVVDVPGWVGVVTGVVEPVVRVTTIDEVETRVEEEFPSATARCSRVTSGEEEGEVSAAVVEGTVSTTCGYCSRMYGCSSLRMAEVRSGMRNRARSKSVDARGGSGRAPSGTEAVTAMWAAASADRSRQRRRREPTAETNARVIRRHREIERTSLRRVEDADDKCRGL